MTAINWTALLNLQAVRVATITKLDRGISSHRGGRRRILVVLLHFD